MQRQALHRLAARPRRPAALPLPHPAGLQRGRPLLREGGPPLHGGQLRAGLHLRVAHAAALRARRRLHVLRARQAQLAAVRRRAPRRAWACRSSSGSSCSSRRRPGSAAASTRATRSRSGTTSPAATSSLQHQGRRRLLRRLRHRPPVVHHGAAHRRARRPAAARVGAGDARRRRRAGFSRRLGPPGHGGSLSAFLLQVGEALPDPTGLKTFYYLVFFVLGFAIVADDRLHEESPSGIRWHALPLGLALSVWWVLSTPLRDATGDPSAERTGLMFLGMLASWLDDRRPARCGQEVPESDLTGTELPE